MMLHRTDDLIALFNGVFEPAYSTRLIRGEDEPLYLPASADTPYHRIIFAHDYFTSGLHEISHWCVAGEARRLLEDYGYWYLPDGRNEHEQAAFETVEVQPQAIESLFYAACDLEFNVSVDNLNGAIEVDRHAFAARVCARADALLENGLNNRARAFRCTLQAYYQQGSSCEEAIESGRRCLDDQTLPIDRDNPFPAHEVSA
ncbi:elongation factor P hydroxylase [Larsenimonas rhizosphaerae]